MYGIINITVPINVKNTMLDTLLSTLAPHYCYGCGLIGSALCPNCINNIINEPFTVCFNCGKTLPCTTQLACQNTISASWCVGAREGLLRLCIDEYKFESVRAIASSLAELLNQRIPLLPSSVVVTNIPTASNHIRARSFDHAALLARCFAKRRGLIHQNLLERRHNLSQRAAVSREERASRAASAFCVTSNVEGLTILLLDDIVTTGSSVRAAAQILKAAGAQEVYVAAVAYSPLLSHKEP
ncbi:ComF family protein [Candidatus Saccharibacteria bacterium]|nr:ComF family protein [Candidatus Saccharibacteria bacterium]